MFSDEHGSGVIVAGTSVGMMVTETSVGMMVAVTIIYFVSGVAFPQAARKIVNDKTINVMRWRCCFFIMLSLREIEEQRTLFLNYSI